MHRRGDDLVERQPAVLVTGSWLTVKEQMARAEEATDRYLRDGEVEFALDALDAHFTATLIAPANEQPA